jgi:hypothetical protein
MANAQTTHGLSGHRLYRVWRGMIARCSCPAANDYDIYGGRGIRVCDRWLSVANFVADMDGSFRPGLLLEREDSNGHYTPENCRWATATEQMRNRSNNHLITHNGRTMCLAAWAEELGLKADTLDKRVRRWGAEDAIRRTLAIPRGGRVARLPQNGEESRGAKLNDSAVSDILEGYSRGETLASLARRHGVTTSAVSLVIRGKRWRHVRPEVVRPVRRQYQDRGVEPAGLFGPVTVGES